MKILTTLQLNIMKVIFFPVVSGFVLKKGFYPVLSTVTGKNRFCPEETQPCHRGKKKNNVKRGFGLLAQTAEP